MASIDIDLLSICQARLELSLWGHLSPYLSSRIKLQDAGSVLRVLDGGAEDTEEWPVEARTLHIWLSALRTWTGGGETQVGGPHYALACATQALIHQRYFVERSESVTPIFDAVCAYWLGKAALSARQTTSQQESSDDHSVPGHNQSRPTLYSLWAKGLEMPSEGRLSPRAQAFLESLRVGNPQLDKTTLTDLQAEVWNLTNTDNPFASDRHVVMCAPTGTGKSTLAEVFLSGPPIWNFSRKSSLYIAPTRALTQAKHRDLQRLFAADPELQAAIVLSTGEDQEQDWRIAAGDFSIACMVYEKANILFSQSRRLLGLVGCVVIDELHMICDLDRGPILEMALTKLLTMRRESETQAARTRRELLRVIGISTEDRPSDAVKKFFSVDDPNGLTRLEPIVIHHSRRPVPVTHNVVIAEPSVSAEQARRADAGEANRILRLMTFEDGSKRTLAGSDLVELNRRLYEEGSHGKSGALLHGPDLRHDLETRLIALLFGKLRQQPRDYRALIFVPGRGDVEKLAMTLYNRLKARGGTSVYHEEVVRRLSDSTQKLEDKSKAKRLLKCARYGILMHHSDIEKGIRRKVEDICGEMRPGGGSQVLFSTETLSYGINLAVSDVFLMGYVFNAQTRMRERLPEALSSCAYHNMTGRAGRLGKVLRGDASVYVLLPRGEDAYRIVDLYYRRIEPLQSQLYVRDDMKAQVDAQRRAFAKPLAVPWEPFRTLSALQFSYPFARSVLDVLRHVNMPAGLDASPDSRDPKSARDILNTFNDSLFMFQQRSDGQADLLQLFECAVRRVLEGCAQPHLNLVATVEDGNTRKYSITPRGEAIIDTGTEIRTVEPLLKLAADVQRIWSDLAPDEAFPTDLYVLCLVAQQEMYRDCIRYTPECKGEASRMGWNPQVAVLNREFVFRELESCLDVLVGHRVERLAAGLRKTLDEWGPIQSLRSAYEHGASDSLLRLFCATIAWIRGDDQSVAEGRIESPGELGPGYQGEMQGFRQFVEKMSWKALALAKMLKTAKVVMPFLPDDERGLHMLVARLRLGCTAEAIPLFWPNSSALGRQEVSVLLAAGITPSLVLASERPYQKLAGGVIAQGVLETLQRDMETYTRNQFNELAKELVAVPAKPFERQRQGIESLWATMKQRFHSSVQQFQARLGDIIDWEEAFHSAFAFGSSLDEFGRPLTLGSLGRGSADEQFAIRVDRRNGLLINTEKRSGERSGTISRASVKLLPLQMRADWSCGMRGQWIPFETVLRSESSTEKLVIVPLPWLPCLDSIPQSLLSILRARFARPGYSLTFVSGAAFAVMAMCIARDYTSGEQFMSALGKRKDDRVFDWVGVAHAQKILDQSVRAVELARSTREKLIRHFEVGVGESDYRFIRPEREIDAVGGKF
ncbi:MAG: DEAD/DEAH box helicase [Bryobacteraceae bacterium]